VFWFFPGLWEYMDGLGRTILTKYYMLYVPEGLSVDWNVNFIPRLGLRRGWVDHICLC